MVEPQESTLQPDSLDIIRGTSINSETGEVADDEASDWGSEDNEDDTGDSFDSTESSDGAEEEKQTEEQRKKDREARALERQRVLEAAGLIIKKSDRKPPPRPARRKSIRKRRPAPAVPEQQRHSRRVSKDLPGVPESESQEPSLRLDDAYERYEAFKQSNINLNRLSLASVETTPSLTSASPVLTPIGSPSTDQDSRSYSHFLHFFGRKTPGNDGEGRVMPVISAPILDKDPSASATTDSEFGTVSPFLIQSPHPSRTDCHLVLGEFGR